MDNKEIKDPKASDLLSIMLMQKKRKEEYRKYANFNRRIFAAAIDTTIALFTLAPVVDVFLRKFNPEHNITIEQYQATQELPETANAELLKLMADSGKLSELLISSSVQMLVLLAACALCWKLWSATPGKLLLGMKIVDVASEEPISDKQILLRAIGYIISCCVFFLGILWIPVDKRRQGWHDKIAGTAVVLTSYLKKEGKENQGQDMQNPDTYA